MPQTDTETFRIGKFSYEVRRFSPDTFDDVLEVVHDPISAAVAESGIFDPEKRKKAQAEGKDVGQQEVDLVKVMRAGLRGVGREDLRLVFAKLSEVTKVTEEGAVETLRMKDVYAQHWSGRDYDRYKWLAVGMKFQLGPFIEGMLKDIGSENSAE